MFWQDCVVKAGKQEGLVLRDNNFRLAKEEVYMVIDSHVSQCFLGPERYPFEDETTYYLKRGYIMDHHYRNTLSAMINDHAWLFDTKEDAEAAMQTYLRLASKAMDAAKKWQARHRKIKQVFPKHDPICYDYDEFLSMVVVDEEIHYLHKNLRVIKVALSEEKEDE